MKRIILLILLFASAVAGAAEKICDTLGFRTAGSANVMEMIRGGVSGVRVSSIDGNPLGALNVNVRGINSVRTDNQPLWIVDGVEVSTDLNENIDGFWQYPEEGYTSSVNPLLFLNPNEVESIEILKDISATTIYGDRGANGVIIVKTKMPYSGARNINWASDFGYNRSYNQNHYLSINGREKNTGYNISGAFRTVAGPISNNNAEYGTLKANFETRANKVVWFGLNALIAVGNTSLPLATTYFGHPSMTLAMRDATLSPTTTENIWASDYDDKANDYRGLISAFLQLNFTPSLYFKLSGGFDAEHNTRTFWYDSGTDFGACAPDNLYGGAAACVTSLKMAFNAAAELTFNKYFGKNHFSATALADFNGNNGDYNTMNARDFTTHGLRGYSVLIGTSSTRLHAFVRSYFHFGGYFKAAYDYDGLAGISGTVRMDSTPKYNQGVKIYPAVEGFVNLKKAVLSDVDCISDLKIRGGWGASGREKFIPYELFGNYLSGNWFTPESGTSAFYDGLNNITAKEWHISLDATLLANRLNLSASVFNKKSVDSFAMYQMGQKKREEDDIWVWKGCENVFERTTEICNHGVEFDLNSIIIKKSSFKWGLSANISVGDNYIVSTNSSDARGRVVGEGLVCNFNQVGFPAGCIFGYESNSAGFVDKTGEGILNDADKVLLGFTTPTIFGGLQTDFSFGRWNVGMRFDGAAGFDVANLNRLASNKLKTPDGQFALTKDYIEKGDFLRFSEIGVKYNIPLSVKWMKSLSVRFSCHNLATLTSYSGWNPDMNSFGSSVFTNGLDYGSFPMSRLFVLGVSAKF